MINDSALRVAIVGCGPAAMYAAEHLLEERGLDVEVDIFERLPTPWGLVRAGVAPDHPEKKRVTDRLFDYFLKHPRVRFFGNVEVGEALSHEELADWYQAVIYATGANSDHSLDIPGENLAGSWSAREFVAWYNGHPDFSELSFDLSHPRAVIVGNGNVALDVARILTLSISGLEKTDIADYALEAPRKSAIREVLILGRRGLAQGAFNNPELEELLYLDGVETIIDQPGEHRFDIQGYDWLTRRKIKTLQQLSERQLFSVDKRIVFRFLTSPIQLTGNGKVEEIRVVRNQIEVDSNGTEKLVVTQDESQFQTGLVLRAIGYKGQEIAGLPFDLERGVIANESGRVMAAGSVLSGSYVTGWIKRGPRGIIGSNKKCARETIDCLLEDRVNGTLSPASKSSNEVLELLLERHFQLVQMPDWLNIDHQERTKGRKQNRPRVKFTRVEEMLDNRL